MTDLLTLNAVSDQPIIIGDSGLPPAPGQYELNEAGSIQATNLVINALGADGPDPDIDIYDYNIAGSLTSGGGTSSVTFNTNSSIQVLGALDYLDAANSDVLSLNAGQRIEVITDAGGSIAMTDSIGDLSGTLNLTAHDIWVADQAIIDQLEIDPNYAGRDADLAVNSGAENDAGYLQAGGIAVDLLGSSFLVQNSGNNIDTLAGLSVGDGGLTIVNEGTDAATVIAYGREVFDGVITGGDAFAALVQPTGNFTPDSTINNCPLGGCIAPPPPPRLRRLRRRLRRLRRRLRLRRRRRLRPAAASAAAAATASAAAATAATTATAAAAAAASAAAAATASAAAASASAAAASASAAAATTASAAATTAAAAAATAAAAAATTTAAATSATTAAASAAGAARNRWSGIHPRTGRLDDGTEFNRGRG